MSKGCLQNWIPTITSATNSTGSNVLPNIQLIAHNQPASSKPKTSAFRTAEAPVEFIYCLSGGLQIFATDRKGDTLYSQIHEGKGAVLHFPFCNGYSIVKPNIPLQVVGLQIHPCHLQHLSHATGCPLHAKLRQVLTDKNEPSILQDTPLPLPVRITLQQILACPLNEDMSDLFLEYKKMELLYLQFNLLNSKLLKPKCCKKHNVQLAHAAKKILMNDLANPPSLQELAMKVGMTRAQLNLAFRSVFGDTVFGVLRKKRLEFAKRMLEDGSSNVTEVAYECGFSSPSHLTKAFSEQFGIPPKQYQTSFRSFHI